MNNKVSIVVPVFNTEKYLDRCLESIVNQTYSNLEIIIVDDGSKNECAILCDEWKKRDNRIKVIHKKNAGLGYARNTGIENATGDYIFFIDSDDFMDINTVEHCQKCVEETQAEIVCYGFTAVDTKGKIVSTRIPNMPKKMYEGDEIRKILLPEMLGDNPETGKSANIEMSAWAAMFSKKLIDKNDWKFVSEREIISEDVFSLLYLYKYVNKVALISNSFYFYCENQGSLTHVYKEDRYQKIKIFYEAATKLIDKLKYDESMKKRLNELYLSFFIGAGKTIVRAQMPYLMKIEELSKIILDVHMQLVAEQAKDYVMNRGKRLFFKMVRWKKVHICYVLLWLQCKRK